VVQGQIFNVGDSRLNMTILQLAETVKKVASRARPVEITVNDSVQDRRNYAVSFRKIREILGFEAATLMEDGIAEMVERFHSGDYANYREEIYSNVAMTRAWHAHRNEAKYVTVARGAAVVGAVRIDDWENPARDSKVHRFVLSEQKPSVLFIPAGYANGFMSLTADAKLLFFSTSTLQESLGDDVRFDARYWDIWSVEER
jgi:dTDP-4-dehydrorhamnose 3,5-epimerase